MIGFTTKFIPGGTLENTKATVAFRFEWLRQLTELVDFLNLELGIIHQDIAPRNLLIDSDKDNIVLFDFDYAACASRKECLLKGRDDVSGVVYTLYELITNDTHFTSIPHWNRNIDMVQNKEWTCNRKLDFDVSTYRNFLNEWVAKRTLNGNEGYLGTPSQITWPDLPTAPDYDVPFELDPSNEKTIWRTGPRMKRTALRNGQYVFDWQRPPQSRLLKRAEDVL